MLYANLPAGNTKRLLMLCLAVGALMSCNIAVVEEPAPPRPDKIDPNPSPAYRSPQESLQTFKLPPGYHLQLVASEPVVQEPVTICWDGDGRMYVAEMRSYMKDLEGTGERLPICRITRLEDTDGDGKMDKSTLYIDSLVLPRMIMALGNRLVVNETYSYNLYAYSDTNNDGKADKKELLYHNDTPDDANLEHQKSGLIWNVDNWIYVTSNPVRYRYSNGRLQPDTMATSPGGQWGLTHDDYGRLYFSSAGGETPALNFQQNPAYGRVDFESQRPGDFDSVWPIIATPDVQGGQERLRPDSTLNHFTASCGQSVYRGDRLPASMEGDLFICEPVGRLIRRAKVLDSSGETVLKNAYHQREFLASTDMNFRPVNTATGPDGCLYIVDMYHGIIQESNWTKPDSYINPQIRRKGLEKHINRGRIYRLVHDGYVPGPKPSLLKATGAELVAALRHPNGWWRDNAQQLLVMQGDQSVVPALKKLATNERPFWDKLAFWKKGIPSVTRAQALWTLDGLHAVDPETVLAAFKDEDPNVRKAAIRISEQFLKSGNNQVLAALANFKTDPNLGVKAQLALSLRYSKTTRAKADLQDLLKDNGSNEVIAKAATKSLNEGDDSQAELRALTANMDDDDQRMVFMGASNFSQLCATCHGPDGKGIPSKLAPPLASAALVKGNKDVLIRVLLQGLKGPVDGNKYPDIMQPQAAHDDAYIASVLSFIRVSLGNQGGHDGLVFADDVKAVRTETAARKQPWSMEELEGINKAAAGKK